MASHPLDHLNDPEHGRSFLLLLCHYALLVFVVVFVSSSSSFIVVLGKSRYFLLVLREIDYGLSWSYEIIPRLFISVARN